MLRPPPLTALARRARTPDSTRSTLRYPGGKSRAAKLIREHIPAGTTALAAPFLGGGSLELACAIGQLRPPPYRAARFPWIRAHGPLSGNESG